VVRVERAGEANAEVVVELLVESELAEDAHRARLGRGDLPVDFAARTADHGDQPIRARIYLRADLRREGVEDVVADERIVDRVAVVAAAEVRVAVVDLEVTDLEGRVLHDRLEE